MNPIKFMIFDIFQIDVDECEDLSLRFEITSMPTFVFLKNGTEVGRFSGANKDKLSAEIEKLS